MTSVAQTLQKPYVVGVDLGGTNVRAAVLERATEKIVARGDNLPSFAQDGVAQTAGQIALAAETALKKARVDNADVLGVGVAVPGHRQGRARAGDVGAELQRPVEGRPDRAAGAEALGLPVHIGNDANLAALGEFSFGRAAGCGTWR